MMGKSSMEERMEAPLLEFWLPKPESGVGKKSEGKLEKGEMSLSERVIKFIMPLEDVKFGMLSVSFLAKRFGMERSKFSRVFKKEMGVTPEEFLNRIKMTRCHLLLMSGRNITIKRISETFGFCTTDYFIKKFKEYYGVVPGKFKELRTNRKGHERRRDAQDRRRARGSASKAKERRSGRERRKGIGDRRAQSAAEDQPKKEESKATDIVKRRSQHSRALGVYTTVPDES
ncbi:MAG: helix-turn-helix transcriptional regulator [bacterium]|nr:helix-turn-helix transcriptional regulator [bacterium]